MQTELSKGGHMKTHIGDNTQPVTLHTGEKPFK